MIKTILNRLRRKQCDTSIVDQMIDDVLKREGGYVNHPADRGGATKYGITIKTLSEWSGKKCSNKDVHRLNKVTARQIYAENYLRKPKIDRLPQAIQPVVFDMAVNAGPRAAILLLQKSLKGATPQGKRLAVDGLIGTHTVNACFAAIQSAGVNGVIRRYTLARVEFYKSIANRNPKQKVFLDGWINRCMEFIKE